jgi:flagellar motor switch protein FliM
LEPAIPNLTAQHWFSASRTGERDSRLLEMALEPVEVELTAVLGHTEVRLEDFLQFEVGDVILLEQKINDPMNLLVEGRPMFAVQAGIFQGKRAIQLLAEKEERYNG